MQGKNGLKSDKLIKNVSWWNNSAGTELPLYYRKVVVGNVANHGASLSLQTVPVSCLSGLEVSAGSGERLGQSSNRWF